MPGRTVGFLVMSAMIAFVVYFLATAQGGDSMQGEMVDENPALAGFDASAFYLPDAPDLGFVEIPAGSFTMGSNPALDRMAYDNERWSANRRQGQVQLDSYYIARYEVTVAQYNAFARATGAMGQIKSGAGDLPVTNITWPEALAYARWLDGQLRESPATPSALRQFLSQGGRVTLPSEAQWERAARGDDGRIFPWGNRPRRDLANFEGSGPVAVGSIDCTECSFGLADMAGNVWELTRSPLQDYPFDESDDARAIPEQNLFVMRGGSWSDPVNNIRAAVRGGVDPGARSATIGFRLVIDKP